MNFVNNMKGLLSEQRKELESLASEYSHLVAEEKRIKDKKQTLKNKMIAMNLIGETIDTPDGKVSIYVSERLKADFRLILALQKEGVDTSELYTKKIDAEKIKQLGEEQKELKQYFEYKKSVGIRVSK